MELYYPTFNGKVIKVTGICKFENIDITSLWYLPSSEKVENDITKLFGSSIEIMGFPKEIFLKEEDLEGKVKQIRVPLRLDPSVVTFADVRGRLAEICSEDYGEGGKAEVYELEIIDSPHGFKGLKYIKFLKILEKSS